MDKSHSEYKYWLAFAKYETIGGLNLLKVLYTFGSMQEAWNASQADWLQMEGRRSTSNAKFKDFQKTIDFDELIAEIDAKDIQIITINDDNYPYLLRQIPDPPAILFVQGDIDSCNLDRTLAVVGSRKCSTYAQDAINSLISDFNGSDVTIVSGMALGIDAAAHRAALRADVKTIAVLGGGFNHIHPKTNMDIYRNILKGNGAVISEYHPDVIPEAWRFPRRNRIVSGLSKGLLVGEANIKSGALITARLALEHNRELMCIPGMLNNPNTKGTHKLIKDGAGLVTDVNDILNYLNWQFIKDTPKKDEMDSQNLLDNESLIYDILSLEPASIDKIVTESNLNIGDIMVILTTLELKGMIKQMPGEQYIKSL